MATLAQLRTAVNVEVGLALVDGAVNQLINRALRQITGERDWWWLELAETGTWPDADVVEIAATARVVKSVVVNDVRLDPLAEQDADTRAGELRLRGWSLAGRDLRVVPTPTAGDAYTIWYLAAENTLAADGDEPLLPDWHQDAVTMLACSMAHDRKNGDKTARANFMDRYRDVRKTMILTGQAKRGAQLPRVRQDVP